MPVATLKPGPNDEGPVYDPGNKMTASLVIIRKETRYDGGIMKHSIGRSEGLVNAMNDGLDRASAGAGSLKPRLNLRRKAC